MYDRELFRISIVRKKKTTKMHKNSFLEVVCS